MCVEALRETSIEIILKKDGQNLVSIYRCEHILVVLHKVVDMYLGDGTKNYTSH